MEKIELKEALLKGEPLAQKFEKLSRKYDSAHKPELLSLIILSILMYLTESELGITTIIMYALFIRLLMFSPILSFFYLLYVKLIGKVFFLKRQKRFLREMNNTLDNFVSSTQLPGTYCNTEIINNFNYSLDHFLADNLKECATLYFDEIKHREVLEEINEMHHDLKEEIQDLNDRTNGSVPGRW